MMYADRRFTSSMAQDVEFEESKHPRDHGKFSSSVGSKQEKRGRGPNTMANPQASAKSQQLIRTTIHIKGMRPFLFEVKARTLEEALRKAKQAHPHALKVEKS